MASQPPRLFVSHHSSRLDVAEHVDRGLAARGVACWIAARDITPGEPFDRAVHQAIIDCDAILLLFCSRSETSRHVKRELILADDLGKAIIPLRLERIDPVELSYHLADSQWIDWIDRRDTAIDRVAAKAREEHRREGTARPVAPHAAAHDAVASPAPAYAPPRRRGWLLSLIAGGSLVLAGLLALILWLALGRGGGVDEAWLVGTWSLTRDCRDPTEFLANGTVILADGTRGRWRLEDGSRLVADFSARRIEIDFERVGEDEINELDGPNPGPAYRCED